MKRLTRLKRNVVVFSQNVAQTAAQTAAQNVAQNVAQNAAQKVPAVKINRLLLQFVKRGLS